jgi:hypothetical protein
MPLINTVERETKRIQKETNMLPQLVNKIDKKLSTGALKRLTYCTKKIITYFHFEHPAYQIQSPIPIAMPSDRVKKAFLKFYSLPDSDFVLAWGLMYAIIDYMFTNLAGKRKSNVLTSENVDQAVLNVLTILSNSIGENVLAKMSNQRSPSEKRNGKSSKRSKRCSSGKHWRRSYRSSSVKRVHGKCVKKSRSRSRRHSRK